MSEDEVRRIKRNAPPAVSDRREGGSITFTLPVDQFDFLNCFASEKKTSKASVVREIVSSFIREVKKG